MVFLDTYTSPKKGGSLLFIIFERTEEWVSANASDVSSCCVALSAEFTKGSYLHFFSVTDVFLIYGLSPKPDRKLFNQISLCVPKFSLMSQHHIMPSVTSLWCTWHTSTSAIHLLLSLWSERHIISEGRASKYRRWMDKELFLRSWQTDSETCENRSKCLFLGLNLAHALKLGNDF